MAKKIFRKDYKPLKYQIEHCDLSINLHTSNTLISNTMTISRTKHGVSDDPLILYGKDLSFISVLINDKPLSDTQYEVTPNQLKIYQLPDKCQVTVNNSINPSTNTSCEGLYRSDNIYITQCESENFRRITYYQDRPDNLATFTTTLIAEKQSNPLLISNGNLTDYKVLDNGYHKVTFNDPNPKPSYLFALVGGQLRTLKDYIYKNNGDKVDLNIHLTGDKVIKACHALDCLKASFEWDKEKYDLDYDLNEYNIVGVPDFNAGAMENKSLNIFNDDSLLVSPDTSTDRDFEWIYTVISHEFFHNYAGNRVTIRNWFELALKEGLATQKEREFVADMLGYTLPRISDVTTLRSVQFPEDAGPTAHPVRNDSYESISNFYTTTTYQKGAELLSMLSGLLGQAVWRRGVRTYFKELDGTAATIDDFLSILGKVSGRDLTQFKRWYEQAGTPILHFTDHYDSATKTYQLTIKQTCPPTPGQSTKMPFHIPIKMGLLDEKGHSLALKVKDCPLLPEKDSSIMLELTKQEQTFIFEGIAQKPIPSLLRDFSAPVKIAQSVHSTDDLIFLMGHDSNYFNRWDAAQTLNMILIKQLIEQVQQNKPMSLPDSYINATLKVLQDSDLSEGLKAKILSLPTNGECLESMAHFDPDILNTVKSFISKTLAKACEGEWVKQFHACQQSCNDNYSPQNAGKRSLKGVALGRLLTLGIENDHAPYLQWAHDQFNRTRNMTDRLSALGAVFYQHHGKMTKKALATCYEMMSIFYESWKDDPQVVDKWLGMQALYHGTDTIEHMQKMLQHHAFDIKNPNNVRALIRGFIRGNHQYFHALDGSGYQFVADFILQLDKLNPSMASDIAKAMVLNNNLDPIRAKKRYHALQKMLDHGLSDATHENVAKSVRAYEQNQRQSSPSDSQHLITSFESNSDAFCQACGQVKDLLKEAQKFIGKKELSEMGTQFFTPLFQSSGKNNDEQHATSTIRRSQRLRHKL